MLASALMRRAFAPLAVAAIGGVQLIVVPPLPALAESTNETAPIMLVLDASGSMVEAVAGGTRMTEAKKAVRDLVNALPTQTRIGLMVYGAHTGSSNAEKAAGCKDITVAHPVGPLDKAGIVRAADAVKPRGYTPIGGALRAAAAALPKEGPRSIVLVSDGEDTCAPPPPCEVAKDLARQGVDLRIHTVGYQVGGTAKSDLTCIAQATGGAYTNVPDARDLGTALTRVTSSALRNYQPAGTPVTGGYEFQDAPLLTPGSSVDTLGFVRKRYYSVEVPQDHTVYFAATVPFERGGKRERVGLHIDVLGVGGIPCHAPRNSYTGFADDGESLTAALSWKGKDRKNSAEECRSAGRYTFVVYSDSARRNSGSVAEDQAYRLPLEMQVGLEPPVTDPGPPPAEERVTFTDPGGPEQPVTGGGSFGTAATLAGSGRYVDTLHFGEVVYYRVRVDWGQSLAYSVAYGPNSQQPSPVANVRANLYSPARDRAEWHNGFYSGEYRKLPVGKAAAVVTLPIRYRNREERRSRDVHETVSAQSVAGWYYLSVMLGRPPRGVQPRSPVAVTLTTSVIGTPEPGPTYVDTLAGRGAFGASDADSGRVPSGRATEVRSADRAGHEHSSGRLWWVVGPVILMALTAALVGGLLYRRRRISR